MLTRHTSRLLLNMSTTTGVQNADENRHLIDLEISQHEKRIQELKTRRNTFAPISCLPPEVLCRIFLLVRDSTADWKPLLWIKITHTSQYWRNVALTCPSLWTLLPPRNARWTEEMLKRSKMASLIVKADALNRSNSSMANTKVALSQISRIKELYLNSQEAEDILQNVLSTLARSAPRLEVLRISIRNRYHTSGTFHIPSETLCETPRLRQLELYSCDFCWDSQLLRGLTHLTLHSVSSNARPTLTQLLDVLRSCPDLQLLDLKHCFPVESSPQSQAPIYLRHLQSLALDGTLAELEPLLRNCSIQATSMIQMSCRDASGVSGGFPALISAIRSLRLENSSSRLPLTRSVDLRIYPSSSMRLACSSYDSLPESIGPTFPSYHTLIDFTGRSRGVPSDLDANIRHICNIHSLDDVAEVSFHTNNVLSPHTILEVFGRLPRLRKICPCGQAALLILQTMTMTPTPGSTTGDLPPIAFPALRNITLNEVDFRDDGPIDVGWMRDQLIERYERGFEVRELRLDGCSRLRSEDIDLLCEIVVDVAWDGEEIGFSEDEEEYYDDGMGSGDIFYDSDSDYDHGFFQGFY